MAKNTGTLIGAPIRINDDQDLYPAALQSEIKGGHHYRALIADLAIFPTHLKAIGMLCYVVEDDKTYQLQLDLSTWKALPTANNQNGGGNNGGGQNNNSDFGEWTALPNQHAKLNNIIEPQYKADLLNSNKSIIYLTAQFSLANDFNNTEIVIGTLPSGFRPTSDLKIWSACLGIEIYYVIKTTGEVKIVSKDGFNLPNDNAANPYHFNLFFNPNALGQNGGGNNPQPYSYVRSALFQKNNCNGSYGLIAGDSIGFDKTYYSAISWQDAYDLAMADSSFDVDGQAYANINGNCTVAPSAFVNVQVTTPSSQNNPYNEFGLKLTSDTAFDSELRVIVDVLYTGADGSPDNYYQEELVLPAGDTILDTGLFPIHTSPAESGSDLRCTITNSLPSRGGLIKAYATGDDYSLVIDIIK